MQEQIGWRALLREVKNEAPTWVAILARLPRLAHQALADSGQQHATLQARLNEISRHQQRNACFVRVLAALVAALGAFEAWRFFG